MVCNSEYQTFVVDTITYQTQSFGDKNKRPMGHIAHLRKQFKSINTYDDIIMLIKRKKKPLSTF